MNRVMTIFISGAMITLATVAAIVGYFIATQLQAEALLAGRISLYVLTAGLIGVVGLGLLWLWGWATAINQARQISLEEHRALVRKLAAEAERLENEANIVVTKWQNNEHAAITQIRPNLQTTTDLLSIPGIRINGKPNITIEDTRRWATWHAFHAPGVHQSNAEGSVPLLADASVAPNWPERINLLDLLPERQGDLNNILLGVTIEAGIRQPVVAPLEKMVHVAVGGASGWGKSEFLRAFAFQIVSASQAAEIALIDLEAATFSPFARSERLRYPIADTERDALAILADLADEIERRKALFRAYPTVDKLSSYNQQASEPLPAIVLLIDEATVLLSENQTIERTFKTQVLRARKYGIYAVAGGQSWKASDFDTAIRGQFSTTVHFQAKDKSSSRVLLGDPAAAELDRIGRAYALIPGRKMIQIQGPALSLMSVSKVMPAQNELPPMPPTPAGLNSELESNSSWDRELICQMYAENASFAEIARAHDKTPGGKQNQQIKAILRDEGLI